MTSFDSSVRAFEFPQFAFSNNKAKKAPRKNKVASSTKNSKSYAQSHKSSYAAQDIGTYSHYYSRSQGQMVVKDGFGPNFGKFGKIQPQNNFSDQYMKSNYASTADSDNNAVFFELSGFKIVQNGKVLHNEVGEDFDSSDNETSWLGDIQIPKFAASTLTIGPNANDISLPSFA